MKSSISFDTIDAAAVPAPTKAFGDRKASPFDPLIAAATSDYDKALKIPIASTKEYMRYRGGIQRAAKRAKVQVAFSKDQNYLYLTAVPPPVKATPQPAKMQPAPKKTAASIAA
jgi:hypothetical protein